MKVFPAAVVYLVFVFVLIASSNAAKGGNKGKGGGDECTPVKTTTDECSACGQQVSPMIIGGSSAQIPFYCGLYERLKSRGHKFRCGAVIISNCFLLTAKHCFPSKLNFKLNNFELRCGSSNMIDGTHTTFSLASLGEHPTDDLTIIKVKLGFTWTTTIAPICLPRSAPVHEEDVKMAGAGQDASGNNMEDDTQEGDGTIISGPNCHQYYSSLYPIESVFSLQFTCASLLPSTVCYGDSGGPMYRNNNGKCELLGLVSRGSRDCVTFAAAYLNVRTHVTYIQAESEDTGRVVP